jgi:diacylglycerol kinase family enzyme
MYYYVYDEFIQDPKFERDLSLVETRLTDLGIEGKIARLALFRDPKELIKDEIRKGAKTIVAVGNDITLRKVIDAATDTKAVVGVIPLGKENNLLSQILGVPVGVEACDILSARIIEELDIGEVNCRRFLHTVEIQQASGLQVTVDGLYKLKAFKKCAFEVRNLAIEESDVRASNPVDNMLDCVVRTPSKGIFKKQKWNTTIIPAKSLQAVFDEQAVCIADGERFESNELKFKVIPRALRVITGRGRKF